VLYASTAPWLSRVSKLTSGSVAKTIEQQALVGASSSKQQVRSFETQILSGLASNLIHAGLMDECGNAHETRFYSLFTSFCPVLRT
jgi:hypothetical protein